MSEIAYTLPDYQITKTNVAYPLSLEVIKRHLRLDNDFVDDDDYIMDLLYASTQLAENYINKAISKTLNVVRIDDFDCDVVKIMEGNFLSIVSVTDASGTSIGTVKQTSAHYDYFTIEWTTNVVADPITITFYTGYDEGQTPEIIKQAILVKIGDLYDNSRTNLIYSGLTDSKVFENLLNGFISIRF